MAGHSKYRPDLPERSLPLEASIPVLPCRGVNHSFGRLFEPLGYEVQAMPIVLDDRFPSWGSSRYVSATLRAEMRVADLLNHLYVLLPVLDDDKHYWVTEDEVENLMQRGDTWLAGHPERDPGSCRGDPWSGGRPANAGGLVWRRHPAQAPG